ncbi:hypothetical protein C2G38_2255112 [Gigaspora rosea]|uniref:Uncharacterized protein n=1 Tax=Gigaspora rosea TaxID=44941 RepID=A0A397TZ11_9GLOM|nr:hypothetical protein C2G38_2255112 [Gigaspora rosea]
MIEESEENEFFYTDGSSKSSHDTNYLQIYTDLLNQNDTDRSSLYSGKKFATWKLCESFLNEWAKVQEFRIIKDCVQCDNGVVRQRTYLYEHSLNTSCPKINNPEDSIIINKIVENYNYLLNPKRIEFEDIKKFSDAMLEDVRFMTVYCKFGATVQRKFLEGKYSIQPIYSNDLYAAIQKFRPNSKTLSNDAAQISNWLYQKKDTDLHWVVVRDWDNDNTLTRLLWMTPIQVENWIQQNILLAQALLIDESIESHKWMFEQIIKVRELSNIS